MTDDLPVQTPPSDVDPTAVPTGDRPISSVRFPAYDLADRNFRHAAFESVRRTDALFSQIRIIESDHVGPIRSVGGSNPFDSPQVLHSATASIAVADIEHTEFAGYAAMVRRTADELIAAFAKTFFGDMGALTRHVGNVVDQKGKGLFEQFKEGIMKVALDFDDAGSLVPPQLIVAPGNENEAHATMQAVFADTDVRARIIAEREKFLASRGRRRLLSPC